MHFFGYIRFLSTLLILLLFSYFAVFENNLEERVLFLGKKNSAKIQHFFKIKILKINNIGLKLLMTIFFKKRSY
jgi:hypothetical protein